MHEKLSCVAELLEANNEAGWARAFHELAAEWKSNPSETKQKVLALYGGMGSFNDIILYDKENQPLQVENEKLNDLRQRLYADCRER